jgi:hypothetical protein
MAKDPRIAALERQIATRSARSSDALGRKLSLQSRGLAASGLIGSSEQERLLKDIREQKALVESESTAARDMLRDQIAYEEDQKRGANLRNMFSIGGTILGAGVGALLAAPTGGLSIQAGMMAGSALGSAAGKIAGGVGTGTWDPTAANDVVQGLGSALAADPVDEIDRMLKVIKTNLPGSGLMALPPAIANELQQRLWAGLPIGSFLDSLKKKGGLDVTQYGASAEVLPESDLEALYGLDDMFDFQSEPEAVVP